LLLEIHSKSVNWSLWDGVLCEAERESGLGDGTRGSEGQDAEEDKEPFADSGSGWRLRDWLSFSGLEADSESEFDPGGDGVEYR